MLIEISDCSLSLSTMARHCLMRIKDMKVAFRLSHEKKERLKILNLRQVVPHV